MAGEEEHAIRVGVHTLGCRLNLYESDGILQSFQDDPVYELVAFEDGPDIAIVNSCTVTDQADSRSRQILNRLFKKNPNARVVFTGCFAQTDPEKVQSIPGVDLVVGNDRKPHLRQIIEDHQDTKIVRSKDHPRSARNKSHPLKHQYGQRPIMPDPFGYGHVRPVGHSRAYIKIQDGCDRKCSYCKIPMARGRGVSRNLHEIIDHVQELEAAGIHEIVLTGVNLGWYRDHSTGKKIKFHKLLEKILEKMRSSRLRLSSIEPCDVNAELARISLHPRFCDFLHVPLQSGSSTILKAMRRTYSAISFLKRIETVLALNPGIFLGTDVIVGFPGESESDFLETLNVCRETRMSNIHAFRYSARAGTQAYHLGENIERAVIKERMGRLVEVQNISYDHYVNGQIGQTRTGILEKIKTAGELQDGQAFGEVLTDNFLRVRLPFGQICHHKRGELLHVLIEGVDVQGKISGKLV